MTGHLEKKPGQAGLCYPQRPAVGVYPQQRNGLEAGFAALCHSPDRILVDAGPPLGPGSACSVLIRMLDRHGEVPRRYLSVSVSWEAEQGLWRPRRLKPWTSRRTLRRWWCRAQTNDVCTCSPHHVHELGQGGNTINEGGPSLLGSFFIVLRWD
ncbi:hypothetical protein VUR80DRAFT_8876 [Thermomyces stellatus]